MMAGGAAKHPSRRPGAAKVFEPAPAGAAPGALASGDASPPPPAASEPPVPVAPVTPAPGPSREVPAPAAAAPPGPGAVSAPVVDAPPALLSHRLVERIASQHARELSKCEGGEELRGEVTVRFSVDAAGKVKNAQVATTLGKPRVAACLLRAVHGWQFPPQGEAGALGAYTLSFQ
jgi:TonB family protein